MRFRRQPPVAQPRQLQHRVSGPWHRPETEFPGIVPIGSLVFERSEQAAMAITGISAYSNGFEFALTRIIRPDAPGWDGGVVPAAPQDWRAVDRGAEISLQLSDGTKVIGGRPYNGSEPTEPILRPGGGGGTSHYQALRWWAWPLPPPGPLEFISQWPTFGIGETRVRIDAQLILGAARRAVRLWPEDNGEAAPSTWLTWASTPRCAAVSCGHLPTNQQPGQS